MQELRIIGHLTADAKKAIRNVAGVQTTVCSFTVAANYGRRGADGQRPVLYVNVTIWRDHAEKLYPYLKKGTLVAASGPLKISVYKSNQDGSWRAQAEINVVKDLELLTAQKRDGDEAPADAQAAPTPADGADPDADEYPFG